MNRKRTGTVVAAAFLLLICLCACQGAETKQDPAQTVPEVQSRTEENPVRQEETQAAESQTPSDQSSPEVPEGKGETMIYAKIGDETLTIRPEENSSAEAFVALLQEGDLTVAMHDYGGFEKVGPLGTDLPTNDESITTEPGDVILYQGNQITIYYDTNTWRFTRLGRVQGMTADRLREVLGSGDPTVVFSLKGEADGGAKAGAFDFDSKTVLLNSGYPMPILGDETIRAIAEAHGVSAAQVILRWDLQRGIVVIPGSGNPEHIRENLDLFGFELTEAEMEQIDALDRGEKHDWY